MDVQLKTRTLNKWISPKKHFINYIYLQLANEFHIHIKLVNPIDYQLYFAINKRFQNFYLKSFFYSGENVLDISCHAIHLLYDFNESENTVFERCNTHVENHFIICSWAIFKEWMLTLSKLMSKQDFFYKRH